MIRVAYCRVNGLDGRGGVEGFSTTYDGSLTLSSKDSNEMHDTGLWETHLGQQKVYMQKKDKAEKICNA